MDQRDVEWYAAIWDDCVTKHRRDLGASTWWPFRSVVLWLFDRRMRKIRASTVMELRSYDEG